MYPGYPGKHSSRAVLTMLFSAALSFVECVTLMCISVSLMCRLHMKSCKNRYLTPFRIQWTFIILQSLQVLLPGEMERYFDAFYHIWKILSTDWALGHVWSCLVFFLRFLSTSAQYFVYCILELLLMLMHWRIVSFYYRIVSRKAASN